MSNYLSDYSALNGELAQALSDSFTLESFIEHQINHDQKFIRSIARMETMTPALLDYFRKFAEVDLGRFISYGHVFNEIIQDQKTNQDILDVFARSSFALKADGLISNKNLRTDTLDHLIDLFRDDEDKCDIAISKTIAEHPNASDWALRQALELSNQAEEDYLLVAKNTNTSAELLSELALIEDGWLTKEVKVHGHSRYFDSTEIKKVKNTELRKTIALHPRTPKATLRLIFEQGDSRDIIVKHPSLSLIEALEWIQDPELTYDENGNITGEGAAITPDDAVQCLTSLLSKFAGKDAFPPLMESAHALKSLFDMGYNLAELASIHKIKQFVKTCINSAHKEEVAFLLRGMTCEAENQETQLNTRHLGLSALSAIQGLFTQDRKMDRHNYLLFMTWVNENDIFPSAFECAADTLIDAEKTIGLDGIKSVLIEQNAHTTKRAPAARDTFLFISELVTHDEPEAVEKQTKLINRWVAKNADSYCEMFHDYLMNKCKRDNGRDILPANFYQMIFSSTAEEINEELKKEKSNVRLYLPNNTAQLNTIGNVQRHCVGGGFYANKCVNGHNTIFAMKIDGTLKHGYTFQFDTVTRSLLQAEGFCRCEVPAEYVKLAKQWMERLANPSQASLMAA